MRKKGQHSRKFTRDRDCRSDGGMQVREVARALGISRSMVYQIEQNALRKLAHPKNAKILKQFLAD